MTRRTSTRIAAATVVVAVAAAGVWLVFARDDASGTDDAMAARAQAVMPFDLARTDHTFTPTAYGGIQTVVVNDPSNTQDRDLIRTHLRAEAENFRRGDYDDPARIHGMDMPGVDELARGADQIDVAFAEVTGGARITYRATD
ncbi:MAG TPA: aspartate carbamoyltransferase, partial [Acidimicrobiia bacterium]|nr:aspartate carbamoyltransferase [Acidimicrobiia bacterium]